MSGTGRGRGEGGKIIKDTEGDSLRPRPAVMDIESTSSSDSVEGSEKVIRGRGGYRTTELNTIPPNVKVLRSSDPSKYREIKAVANYVEVHPMKQRTIYQYRVDFNPSIESVPLRRQAFRAATEGIFPKGATFDGMYDARSSTEIPGKQLKKTIEMPGKDIGRIEVTIKQVGTIAWQSFEMLRLYNTNMKAFLRSLGFFQVSQAGAYVHMDLKTDLNEFRDIYMLRGFRTAVNVHENGKILMNLEPVHKLMQANNVRQLMVAFQKHGPRLQEAIKAALIGKLCVTSYTNAVYRIEDVNFGLSPMSTFTDFRSNAQISYKEYFRKRYDLTIRDDHQPLLLVVQNNRRKAEENDKEIYLIPELCNLAGLTDSQRTDNRLKFTLIQTSQVAPKDRVTQMRQFLNKFHTSNEVAENLNKWGYTYDKEPVEIIAKQFPPEPVGIGRNARSDKSQWPKIDQNASFDYALVRDSSLAVTPKIARMAILIAKPDLRDQNHILGELKKGFGKVGLSPESVKVIPIPEGDSPHNYVNHLRQIDQEVTCTIIILNRQNKERYDAVKKLCSVERGIITQVVTAKLMTNDRKAGGAAVKIGVQVAAKVGGEPWYIDLPLKESMVCGYDTYHDTANRGRSFGAFVSTVNTKYSRWFSRADAHDRLDELSAQVASNMKVAMGRYKAMNDKFPERVFLYRDGVSEGQIEHVFNVELHQIKKEIAEVNPTTRLTMIIVNKRVGARFYARMGDSFGNLPPGTVVDDIITRKERYDFYLVSQATRAGTVTPTYYNIIHDESGLAPHMHQAMAYKMSMLYYNWTGTVRVPAPCQYAHKLALLCGEHLHSSPSSRFDDKLHFL